MKTLKITPSFTKENLLLTSDKIKADFNALNSHYMPFFCKSENPMGYQNYMESTVWQQMPINYFYNFLKRHTLFFKRFSKYSPRDERPLDFYKKTYETAPAAESEKAKMQNVQNVQNEIIKNFQNTVYLSCWYHSKNLTDIVFKEYAKGSVGVAIGTDISTLLTSLDQNSGDALSDKYQDELFYSDTVYLSDDFCETTPLTNSSDLITPLFIKSENHNDDKEFRLAYIKNSYYTHYAKQKRTSRTKLDSSACEEHLYAQIGDPKNFIKKIAVRNDDICTLELTQYLLGKLLLNIPSEDIDTYTWNTQKIDGFTILDLT